MDALSGLGKGTMEEAPENITAKIASLVSDSAKPCVAKALDYTLLVLLLVLQFMRCSPPSTDDLIEQLKLEDGNLNVTYIKSDLGSIYSCDISSTQSSVFFASNSWINGLVFSAIIIAFIYGLVGGVGVWIHSMHRADIEVPPMVQKLYSITDRIMIIDTLIEIPIAFYWTPIATLLMWIFFCISCVGLTLLSVLYARTVPNDPNAQSVFNTSAFLVAFSLFKLTGEVSQYWVQYTAATKFNREEAEGVSDKINTVMSNLGLSAAEN